MHVDPATGLVEPARQCPSPNRDRRPSDCGVELLVVHGISLPPGVFGGDAIERLFTNTLEPGAHPYFATIAHRRVSAHLLIRRDGTVVQFVPLHERAWHAGASAWRGRSRCNDFAVGAELEGTDEIPYEAIQYERLAAIVAALARAYPRFDETKMAGHADIAPERKTDPGPAFDWAHLQRLVARQRSPDP